MKHLILVACLVFPGVLATPTDYVHALASPEFQYRSDQEVTVPFLVQLVQGNVPREDAVSIRVVDQAGSGVTVQDAEALLRGVRPYPTVNYLRFGFLEPGLYKLAVVAEAGGERTEYGFDISVVLPPLSYTATLEAAGGDDAAFFFTPGRTNGSFEISVYRDGPGGRFIMEHIRVSEETVVEVPYVPGEKTKVEVMDPHGWTNYENRDRDPLTGRTSYLPWIWDPAYTESQNYQDRAPLTVGLTVALILVAVGIVIFGWRAGWLQN